MARERRYSGVVRPSWPIDLAARDAVERGSGDCFKLFDAAEIAVGCRFAVLSERFAERLNEMKAYVYVMPKREERS